MNEDKDEGIKIIGYPIKDWVVLVSLIGSLFGGAYKLGGLPSEEAKVAINAQTEIILEDIRTLSESIDHNTRMVQRNTLRIDNTEEFQRILLDRLDSLQNTTIDGLKNLDGYFRGRLDQIK